MPPREPLQTPSAGKVVPVRPAATADNPICWRYPTMRMCGCTIPCRQSIPQVTIDKVLDGLYVGPIQAAYKRDELVALGVKYVLNMSGEEYAHDERLVYRAIRIADEEGEDIAALFEPTCDAIDAAISEEKVGVLVHCKAGVSRSVTICTAYVMRTRQLPMQSALALVHAGHPVPDACILAPTPANGGGAGISIPQPADMSGVPMRMPNASFLQQLRDYERTLGIDSGSEK